MKPDIVTGRNGHGLCMAVVMHSKTGDDSRNQLGTMNLHLLSGGMNYHSMCCKFMRIPPSPSPPPHHCSNGLMPCIVCARAVYTKQDIGCPQSHKLACQEKNSTKHRALDQPHLPVALVSCPFPLLTIIYTHLAAAWWCHCRHAGTTL